MTIVVPKPKGTFFDSRAVDRHRQREESADEALAETHFQVSGTRGVEDTGLSFVCLDGKSIDVFPSDMVAAFRSFVVGSFSVLTCCSPTRSVPEIVLVDAVALRPVVPDGLSGRSASCGS